MVLRMQNLKVHSHPNYILILQGVSTREPDYGGISSVEYLDAKKTVAVWNVLASILSGFGYQVGKSAPYE